MIVEQCYRILLDSTAQAVRPGFIIDFEPQDRWRKSIIRHYRPAPRGICNARRYRRDCAKSGASAFQPWRVDCIMRGPASCWTPEAMPRSRKTILCRVCSSRTLNPISPLVLGPS